MSVCLKVRKLVPHAKLPAYAHVNDAACDLFASHDVTLAPMERVQVGTGLAFEIPKEHVVFIWDKSGLSHVHGLKTLGGVIDEGYRGEVKVGLVNLGDTPYTIESGHKVAQMVLQKKEVVVVEEVEELSSSVRGEGGFGSTGK